mmetsp:Transcript_4992/g.12830  ORF Transcript_4992/g.12830 Transcript_4992/m.12830 type:complete len:678 (+) Transcript_4992:194-2227(+)
MLPPTLQKQESALKLLSSKKILADRMSTRMEEEDSSTSNPNANKAHHEVDYFPRRSKFKSHFNRQHSDKSFRSLNSSGSGGSCGPGLLTGNRPTIPTRNIVNRALEVMSNSMKSSDYVPQKPVKSADDCDTEEESEKEQTPSDCSNSSDIDNDVAPEAASRLGNITAQLSFRKIAKKRRKAGGRSSFHHTKSSKEYLRKAQEAYQRLKIDEQEQLNDQNCQLQLENDREITGKSADQCKNFDASIKTQTSTKFRESKVIDYGYGDTSDIETKDAVDYGYGHSIDCHPHQKIQYGGSDTASGQSQQPRRAGRARRRNSVTKFSLEAANVVAAQAAAERILRLKPSLTSLSRSYSTTPMRRRQPQDQPQRLNSSLNQTLTSGKTGKLASMQTTLQRQQQRYPEKLRNRKEDIDDKKVVECFEPPQRSSCDARGICVNRGSKTRNSSCEQEHEQTESKQCNDDSPTLQTTSSHSNPHFQLTSDYFSSDLKPKDLNRKNSGRFNNATFRFNKPARTSSWLSNDNSYSTLNNNDDEDADSLASDMESLCSIRDDNYRLDNHHSNHTLRKNDMPPVLPRPASTSLVLASPAPDPRSRFSSGRSSSGDGILRKPLIVSWSNGSKKDGSLSRFGVDKIERQNGGKEFPILPCAGVMRTERSNSKSCMPAPINRTPSYKGSQQRQV